MLYKGETFNKRKAELMEDLKRSRNLMIVLQACVARWPRARKEWLYTYGLASDQFNHYLQELILLKRWKLTQGIGDDDEYGLPTTKSD
jgi:hypothetical protein